MITIKSALGKVADHPGEMHLLYGLIAAGLIFYGGFWYGQRQCEGMSETEVRQLKGDLTEAEKKITAADEKIGKVQTELKDQKSLNASLTDLSVGQQADVAKVQSANKLLIQQIARLSASFNATRTDATAGITKAGGATECGACQGEIRFGNPPYVSCSWADYQALKAGKGGGSLTMALGVKIDHVTLKQKPKDGALEAVIDRVWLTQPNGEVIAEGKLDPSSKVFTAPNEMGDQMRRHLWITGGVTPREWKVGMLTQKGVRPLIWGLSVGKPFGAGSLTPEATIGFQFR